MDHVHNSQLNIKCNFKSAYYKIHITRRKYRKLLFAFIIIILNILFYLFISTTPNEFPKLCKKNFRNSINYYYIINFNHTLNFYSNNIFIEIIYGKLCKSLRKQIFIPK